MMNVARIKKMKQNGERITMLTAYDFQTARVLDECGVDVLLVGDSLGAVMLGYEDSTRVTMEDMLHHVKPVARAAQNALVVADMPFMSYHTGKRDACLNAARLVREGGAKAVKLEGGEEIIEAVEAVLAAGVPVMGHIGLQPQSVNKLGGYYIQGKDEAAAERLITQAQALERAGAFAVVLECVAASSAAKIAESVSIPIIGIGAGVGCDGQVLVVNDMLGLFHGKKAKFVKQYADITGVMTRAVNEYMDEVRAGTFPDENHSF